MYDDDRFGMKRMELGDKNCEILYAIKKRNKDFNNVTGLNSNTNAAIGGSNSNSLLGG